VISPARGGRSYKKTKRGGVKGTAGGLTLRTQGTFWTAGRRGICRVSPQKNKKRGRQGLAGRGARTRKRRIKKKGERKEGAGALLDLARSFEKFVPGQEMKAKIVPSNGGSSS